MKERPYVDSILINFRIKVNLLKVKTGIYIKCYSVTILQTIGNCVLFAFKRNSILERFLNLYLERFICLDKILSLVGITFDRLMPY